MPSTYDAVQSISTVFAKVEQNLRKNLRMVRQLKDDYQAIHDNGDAGALASMAAFSSLDALVTSQYADVLIKHAEQTATAKSLGIDVGPLEPEPDDGGIVVLGGGDR